VQHGVGNHHHRSITEQCPDTHSEHRQGDQQDHSHHAPTVGHGAQRYDEHGEGKDVQQDAGVPVGIGERVDEEHQQRKCCE
jgi:hypothetical protein